MPFNREAQRKADKEELDKLIARLRASGPAFDDFGLKKLMIELRAVAEETAAEFDKLDNKL